MVPAKASGRMIDAALFDGIRSDTIFEWWKEAYLAIQESHKLGQKRRILWLNSLVSRQECGCADDLDWLCPRCWILANGRWYATYVGRAAAGGALTE